MATLSTKSGGLGLRSAAQHSCAAFLASHSSCHELCKELDPNHTQDSSSPTSAVTAARTAYNAKVPATEQLTSPPTTALSQQELSAALDSHTLTEQQEHRSDDKRRAHLNLTSASGAGQWLHVQPSKAFHKDSSPILYKTSIQRWLRAPIFQAEFCCPLCDDVMDIYGDHCLVCSVGGDRTKRHHLLRNEAFHLCTAAGLHSELEKPGLLCPRPELGGAPEDGQVSPVQDGGNSAARRPADVYLPRHRLEAPACLDFAVTSGLRNDVIASTLLDRRLPAIKYEDHKCAYLDTKATCEVEGMSFIPVVVEACGGSWGPQAQKLWSEIAKTTAQATGELEATVSARI